MSVWGKPKPTIKPTTSWWNQWWVQHDLTKVLGHTPLLKQQIHPFLENTTQPTKNSRSSKVFTQFDTLSLDILNNIYTCHFSLVHHKEFNKVLAHLTQNNPLLRSNRYYKLK